MFYQAFGIGLAVFALILLVLALRVLFRRDWFMIWLRGTMAFAALMLALVMGLAAWDIHTYHSLTAEEAIATVETFKLGDQLYEVKLKMPERPEQTFEVRGDQWQLDARLLTWKGPLAAIGMKPGYRLDRLGGRYLSLEQETGSPRTLFSVETSATGVDVWSWVKSSAWLPWVDANYGAATFMPLSDGASYAVSLNNQGMVARPLNSIAVDAVEAW